MIPRVIHPMTLTREEVRAVALDAVERADEPLGAPEVSPAVQAAFAAGRLQGRREGFLEAVAIMREAADGLAKEGGPILATVADGLRHVARQIESSVARSGEP